MKVINIYEDPDYGWSVMDNTGHITPCENFDSVVDVVKKIGQRFQPSNTAMQIDKKPCMQCEVWKRITIYKFCPDCGRSFYD